MTLLTDTSLETSSNSYIVRMNPGELLEAAEEGDVQRVVDILSQLICDDVEHNHETAELLDDVDSDGKTSLMAAARGAGSVGENYANILKLLWEGHKRCGTSEKSLKIKGKKHGWNVLMHSAKCGDAKNLNIVLDMYTEVFGALSSKEDEIDWVNVDHKVKKLVSEKVFAGNADPISNFAVGRRKRPTRREPAAAAAAVAAERKQKSNRAQGDDAMAKSNRTQGADTDTTAKAAARSINNTRSDTATASINAPNIQASQPLGSPKKNSGGGSSGVGGGGCLFDSFTDDVDDGQGGGGGLFDSSS